MMDKRDTIIATLKATFDVETLEALKTTSVLERTHMIHRLSTLLQHVDDEETLPKILAHDLENVIVAITLKSKKSPDELKFLQQVEKFVVAPLYTSEENLDEGEDHCARLPP